MAAPTRLRSRSAGAATCLSSGALVALEYIVFQSTWDALHSSPPSLFEHEFTLVASRNRYGLPPFYELHAWLWKPNPSGMFYEWNPNVSCG